MTVLEQAVAAHYARPDLADAILSALERLDKPQDGLRHSDLAPVDEFHIGGRAATEHLAGRMQLRPGWHLLDIGCGLGGASRYLAAEQGCRVTGIDLTPDYCRIATILADRVGLSDAVTYRQASALALPFEDGTFDGAYTIHVGMNIADKPRLYAEAHRVIRPGGVFAVYDVLQGPGGPPAFPVPWAATAETSFLASLDEMRALLAGAGFTVAAVEDRTTAGTEFFETMRRRVAESGMPPLGLHLVMGPDAPAKIDNVLRALVERRIAPTEIIATA